MNDARNTAARGKSEKSSKPAPPHWGRRSYRWRAREDVSTTQGKASPLPARLLIADDHDLVREGLRAMLSREPDLKVIGEAADGQEALDLCCSLRPDLVLMDLRMPRMDGIEATRAIREECPATSVLVVTIHESPEYLPQALAAGAAGYVLKDATSQQLLEAVWRVLDGESPLNEGLAELLSV